MLDINRNSQVFHDAFAAMPTANAIVAHVEHRAYWDNQTVEIRLQSSQDTELDWGRYRLRWELNKVVGIEKICHAKETTMVMPLGVARIPMPRVEYARVIPLTLTLITEKGFEAARHSYNLLVLPSRAAQARYGGNIAVMTIDGRESAIIRQLNYGVVESLSDCTQIVITNSPDEETLRWVRDGGKMLFVRESEDLRFWQFGHRSVSDANWITSSSWLSPDVYRNLKIENPLNLPLQRVMPRGSITGLPHENPLVHCDFLAGQISGWVQRPNIHTVQFGYGRGKVIMTTYALLDSLRLGDPDPVGILMLNDLIDYLVSDLCQPHLRIDD